MTLKSSFLADIVENIKRRNWVFSISFLFFLCYFPGYLILSLNNIRSRYGEGIHRRGIEKDMKDMAEAVFHDDLFLPVFVIGLAGLIGIQGFAYLHDKRQVDFYHSQPVSRKRRFFVLWSNGIIIFITTYLVNLLLGMLVAAGYRVLQIQMITEGLQVFLLNFLLFLGVYHLAILAVLLTGNTLVSLLAAGILLGYEVAARAMTVVMASSFFLTYGNGEEEKIFRTWFSPIVDFYQYSALSNRNSYYTGNGGFTVTYGETALRLILLAFFFWYLSFFCYKKRDMESHGRSISFSQIKEGVKFLLLLLWGSIGIYGIYHIAGESIGLGILGGIFFVALGHGILQVIYEVDFRAIKKRWKTSLLALAAVILVFLGFRYDMMKYDHKIPKKEKVESVYLSLAAEGFTNEVHVMEDGTEIWGENFSRKEMKLTDLNTIYDLLEERERIGRDDLKQKNNYDSLEVIFRLNNGNTISRRLYFTYEDNFEQLDKIYKMEEYQLANNQVLEENFVEKYQIILAEYNNGFSIKEVKGIEMKALAEAYKKDLNKADYKEVYSHLPLGKIRLSGIGLMNPEYRNTWEILIYDSYENTIALLEQSGLNCRNAYINEAFDRIEQITVSFTDEEKMSRETEATYEECTKTVVYQSEELYRRILQNTVPEENSWWSRRNKAFGNEYSVYVDLRDEFGREEFNRYTVQFIDAKLPEFILKDLEETEYGKERIIE